MTNEKEVLIQEIENARERLNASIGEREAYGTIYKCSLELDQLLNKYLLTEF